MVEVKQMNEIDNHDDGTPTSGVIKHPCIVTFTDMPEIALLPHGLRLLCGTIQQDFKDRLQPGMQFRSSPIYHVTGDLVTTANSLYRVEGDIDHVALPIKYLQQVLGLIDPRHIKSLLDAGFTDIRLPE